MSNGYWNSSCVTRDGRFLVAGGDHAALLDVATGKVVEQVSSRVKAIGCDESSAIVIGYDGAWRLPGKEAVTPVPAPSGDVLTLTPGGAWVSWARTIQSRKWRGPATLFVTGKGEARRTDLLPAQFGKVGGAKSLPTPDTFAVRLGTLLEDGRLLTVAGWQPAQNGGKVDSVPWGFFALSLQTGEAAPLSMPLPSDPALNQNWVQKIACNPDASSLVIAAHDGEKIAVGQFDQGADKPTRVSSWDSKGAANAVAVSNDGTRVAVGTESRGKDAPGKAWVIDEAGKAIWTAEFPKTVVGLHFLDDGSLIVISAEAKAMRVALPAAKETWRTP